MAGDISITDPADPRLADYRNLSDAELRRERGAFIAEGRLVVRRLMTRSRFRTRSVLVTPAARASLDDVLAPLDGVPVFVCALELLREITGYDIHRGCLAVGDREAATPVSLPTLIASCEPIVVLDAVGNPDNVGGIFRTAAAFGAAGIVLGPGCGDPLYRKAIRTSMGAALTLPFVFDEAWPATFARLREAGWTIAALTPDAPAQDLDAFARERHERVAVVLGSEGSGLSEPAMRAADRRVRIPMRGGTDSLNVTVAAGIALHALARGEH